MEPGSPPSQEAVEARDCEMDPASGLPVAFDPSDAEFIAAYLSYKSGEVVRKQTD